MKVYTKTCKICGDIFETENRYRWMYCDKQNCHDEFFKEKNLKMVETVTSNWGGVGFASKKLKKNYDKIIMEKYKVEHPSKSSIIRKKTIKTNLERYNVENILQLKEYKDKRETVFNNNKDDIQQKRRMTNNKKYKTDYPLQNKEIQEKAKKTKFKKYGDEYFNNREKYKETSLKNWGVEYPMQSLKIINKQQRNSYNTKEYILPSGKVIKIQGYEWIYLNEYFFNGGLEEDITNDKKLMPEIWYYTEDGKKHIYFPDFYIKSENMIIEVKSVYTYGSKLKINLLKEQASLNDGYRFEFKIYDEDKKKIAL